MGGDKTIWGWAGGSRRGITNKKMKEKSGRAHHGTREPVNADPVVFGTRHGHADDLESEGRRGVVVDDDMDNRAGRDEEGGGNRLEMVEMGNARGSERRIKEGGHCGGGKDGGNVARRSPTMKRSSPRTLR